MRNQIAARMASARTPSPSGTIHERVHEPADFPAAAVAWVADGKGVDANADADADADADAAVVPLADGLAVADELAVGCGVTSTV